MRSSRASFIRVRSIRTAAPRPFVEPQSFTLQRWRRHDSKKQSADLTIGEALVEAVRKVRAFLRVRFSIRIVYPFFHPEDITWPVARFMRSGFFNVFQALQKGVSCIASAPKLSGSFIFRLLWFHCEQATNPALPQLLCRFREARQCQWRSPLQLPPRILQPWPRRRPSRLLYSGSLITQTAEDAECLLFLRLTSVCEFALPLR